MTEQQRADMVAGRWFPIRLADSLLFLIRRHVGHGNFETFGKGNNVYRYHGEAAAQAACDKLNAKLGAM